MSSDLAKKALTKARIRLLRENPFLGTLALGVNLVEQPGTKAATDGTNLYYDPDFWLKLSEPERIGVLAHEIAHNALLHSYRLKGRDHEKFNKAADYAINDLLVNTFRYSLPSGALLDRDFYELSAEEIYNRLPDDPKGKDPAPDWGNVLPAPGNAQQQASAQKAAEGAVRRAAQVAKMAGNMPGALASLVDFLEPKINWKAALREFLSAKLARDDYRWYPPNLQYLHMDMHVPTLAGESFGPVVLCIDTSGSIGEKELSEFLGEVSGILEDCKPESAMVIYCDSEINHIDTFTVEDLPIKPKMFGGGGTDFRPPFDHLKKQGIEPECLLYFTDMYGAFPEPTSYPTIWARTSKQSAPFGTHIDMEF
jgi:predicted metal-dependent peptidase